jgi:hypothetical protein
MQVQSRRWRTIWSLGSTMPDCHRHPAPTSNSLAESLGPERFTALMIALAKGMNDYWFFGVARRRRDICTQLCLLLVGEFKLPERSVKG